MKTERDFVMAHKVSHYTAADVCEMFGVSRQYVSKRLPKPDIISPFGKKTRMWIKDSVVSIFEKPDKLDKPNLVSINGIAERYGISKKRMERYVDKGLFPKADYCPGVKRMWLLEVVEAQEAYIKAQPKLTNATRCRDEKLVERPAITPKQVSDLQLANRFYRCLAGVSVARP